MLIAQDFTARLYKPHEAREARGTSKKHSICSSTRDEGSDKSLHSELALNSQGGSGHCAAVAAVFYLKIKK